MRFLTRRSAQTVAVLAVTQLIGWGTTFETLGVLGRTIAPDLGMPNEVAFAGLSVMMVVSALAGPTTGRLLGRYGASRVLAAGSILRSEEHTSELQSLMRSSYAVFFLDKKKKNI